MDAIKAENKESILNFRYSFGYDSQRWCNLCVCDENVIAWASGSIITFYDVIKKQKFFHKSTTGGSIGHITKNSTVTPTHIAIGQGKAYNSSPLIEICEWPSMKIIKELKNGTSNAYSNLNYNHDGTLLASLGGSPDFDLTIWDWRNGTIKLKTCAFSFSVYNVQFSPYVPEQLITNGVNHLKFWKMTSTFTGLKLKSTMGCFGKTDICDILGILPLPDEKVLSGCSWGNILVWEAGIIKSEIFRKGHQLCHQAPISQILYCAQSNETITVGLDGHICTWCWNTNEITNTNKDNAFIEINPVSEIIIPGSQLMCIKHRRNNEWFAQDMSGAIWEINLNSGNESGIAKEIEVDKGLKIINSHGSGIAGIISLRYLPLLISLGHDGTFLLHKLPCGPILTIGKYLDKASCIYYMPKEIDKTGMIFVFGFCNGTIRLVLLNLDNDLENIHQIDFETSVILLQLLKPHTKQINVINTNVNTNILLTASDDYTIFAYKIMNTDESIINLVPLYYVETPKIINSIIWKPNCDYTILMAAQECHILEAELPISDEIPNIDQIISLQKHFTSIRVTILKNYCLWEKESLVQIASEQFNNECDIDLVQVDNDASNSIIWAKYDSENASHIWAAQENCSCIFRLTPGENYINKYAYLNENFNDSIISYLNIDDKGHVIIGTSNGELVIFKMPMENDNVSYVEIEQNKIQLDDSINRKKIESTIIQVPNILLKPIEKIIIHDTEIGKVTHMTFSLDKRFLYTAGEDGNVFSFEFNFSTTEPTISKTNEFDKILITDLLKNKNVKDDMQILSHEEFIQEKEKNALIQDISLHKEKISNKLNEIKTEAQELLKLNSKLPISQQIEIEEDSRVQKHIVNELNKKINIIHRRLAYPLEVSSLHLEKMLKRNIEHLEIFPFQVISILNKNCNVKIIRQKKLPITFFNDFENIQNCTSEPTNEIQPKAVLNTQGKLIESKDFKEQKSNAKSLISPYTTSIMDNLPKSPPPSHILTKALRIYLHRLERQRLQEINWQEHLKKCVKNKTENSLVNKEMSLGEYRLKSQLESVANSSKYEILFKMFLTRKVIYDLQQNFNESVILLKNSKAELSENFTIFTEKLTSITTKLPADLIEPCLFPVPTFDNNLEYPEKNLHTCSNVYSNFISQPSTSFNINPNFQPTSSFPQEINKEYQEQYISSLIRDQNGLIKEMKNSIDDWEKKLKVTDGTREKVLLRSQLLRLHLLHLTQEKLILDSFESLEKKLAENVLEIQLKLQIAHDQKNVLQVEIDSRKSNISILAVCQKELMSQLHHLIKESQYSSFLKRVFKKKTKISESNSSTSISSDDEDSIASEKGTTRIRLDSNSCPPGCDPEIYEATVNLRSRRHKLDNDIKEEESVINAINKDVSEKMMEIEELTNHLKERQNDLKILLHKKQLQLNDIDSVVILRAEQCRIDALEDLRSGKGALIFPASAMQTLQQRVHQQLKEADEQKKLYNMSKTHLHRLQADCDFINQKIVCLQNSIQRILEQKLGLAYKISKLNYDHAKKEASKILDNVLECMINQFKIATTSGLTKDMHDQLSQWKKKKYELEQHYCSILQDHTTKLRTATTLQAELFTNKDMRKSNDLLGKHLEQDYKKDLNRLKHIHKAKEKQIEDLRAEVQRLKLKPYKSPILPPLSPTNISTPPSIAITPPPSELPLDITSTKSIAMSLAKELNDANLQQLASQSHLMIVIGEVLPLLIEGKINVNQAADIVVEKFKSDNSDENDKSRKSIAEIFSQITKQIVKFGEMDVTTNLQIDEMLIIESTKHFQLVIKGLLDAGVSSEDTEAIDVAVSALVDIAPHLITHKINTDEVVDSIKESGDYEEDKIKDLVLVISESLSAQSDAPAEISSIAAEFLKQLRNNLTIDNKKKTETDIKLPVITIKSDNGAIKKSQSEKKVSLCDFQSSPKSTKSGSTSNKK